MNFQAVLAGLPDAVIAVDEQLRVVFWNSATEVLTERSARRAEGRLLRDIFGEEASLVRRLGETLASGESRSEPESYVERADHRLVPVSIVTAALFDREGRVEAAVAVLRDVSRIRQLEAEVRRGETLAAAGRMAVGLAHEIRNPLGAIRGAVQLLGRELGPASPLHEYTTVLLTEVDRVNRIIEMLLDLARPAAIRPVPLNLHQLLERVALLSEESARERKVTIVRRYDPSLPPILGDEDRLVQVFHNLVRNAVEAMPDGGLLTLTTRVSMNPLFGKVDLGGGQRHMVEAQVMDEGTGIPAATRAKIFDPFFTTKEPGKGTGLGLSTVYGIVTQSHGHIEVDSEPGAGSSFRIFFPCTDRAVDPDAPAPRTPTTLRGSETILLVEDDEQVRRMNVEVLRGHGYLVLDAQSGAEALATAASFGGDIHLLVTDVVMPGMSGPALAERIAETRPTTRSLYVSGYAPSAIVHHGVLEAGIAFLPKPISPDALLHKVRELLTPA
jgi:two-component system cell cycle sensor histidine kinase/response regulator CckA